MGAPTTHAGPFLAAAALICAALAAPADAHREIREWRSLGSPQSVAVNSHDGSVWAAIGSFVHHLSSDGTRRSRVRFIPDPGVAGQPTCVAVNPNDGSCWAFGQRDRDEGTLVHYAADGSELWRQGGLGRPHGTAGGYPPSLGVYPADGSCWLAYSTPTGTGYAGHLRRLSASGQVLFARDDAAWTLIGPLAVNPSDGSCSAVVGLALRSLVHLAADGAELWTARAESEGYFAVGVNPSDGSVWVYDWPDVVRLAADGHELWRKRQIHGVVVPTYAISVNPTDGSAWLAGAGLWHMSENGTALWHEEELHSLPAVAVDPRDGSAWGAKWDDEVRLVHLAADGITLWEMKGDYYPGWGAADAADGSCWVTDNTRGGGASLSPGVAHVSAAGATLWHGAVAPDRFACARAVAANPRDRSAWLVEEESPSISPGNSTARLIHLSAAGGELARIDVAEYPSSASRFLTETADSSDGSVWVSCADLSARISQLQRYAADATLAWSTTYPGNLVSLSADPRDGSCWLASEAAGGVVRLARDGTTLAQYNWVGPSAHVAVDSADGSCWVADQYQVIHLSAGGSELWRSPATAGGGLLSVDSETGFCWGAGGRDVFAYSWTGLELWRGPVYPWKLDVNSRDGSCWFSTCNESANSERELGRLQIPLTPFGDISYWHWARDEINACAEADIVQGYPSGAHAIYRPDQAVTRDQMAVYLARAFAGGDSAVPDPAGEPTFPDVGTDHWAYRYIEYCAQQDLVLGYPSGGYEPDLVVTRDQMAVYIARALVGGDALVPTGPAEAHFPDVGTDHWAYDYVSYCQAEGIVQGYPDGTYRPEVEVTRDQMAVYVARAFDLSLEWRAEESALLTDPPDG
jgi:hypothetical protein